MSPTSDTGTSIPRRGDPGLTETRTSSPTPDASTARLRIRDYRGGDEIALVEIFSAVFGRRTLDEWRWLFESAPGGPAQIQVLEYEGDSSAA